MTTLRELITEQPNPITEAPQVAAPPTLKDVLAIVTAAQVQAAMNS